ncbi:MAG: Fe-S cluster assembly protein SufD [Phycisphaerales bacterium]|nr:Fe-S cluster assembly protein SufD [Phycisphaerales bacterium]
MTVAVKERAATPFVGEFDAFEKKASAAGPGWLMPIRKAAIARFAEVGIPTTRDEDWRYTNVSGIAKRGFRMRTGAAPAVQASEIEPFVIGVAAGVRLVFVNGAFSAALSRCPSAGKGVAVGSLTEALKNGSAWVHEHLTHWARYQAFPFAALNTAFMEDGAVVHVPRGVVVESPIEIVHLTTAGDAGSVNYPRTLIVAEAQSQVTVTETYAGLNGSYFNDVVTEIVAGESAVVDYYKVVRERPGAFHVGLLHVQQHRSSTFTAHTSVLGEATVRNNVTAVMDGEGCDCTLNGMGMMEGDGLVDNHLRVEHAKPHCRSWEYYKAILDGRSRGVFTGRIVVSEGAQKTDAKQTNMNLILSDEALADSKPQLEIFADDVKCTHGATIGQIDGDAIFYLRSRGMSAAAARSLLVYAFASESLNQIRVPALRTCLERLVLDRLPGGRALGAVA